MSLKVNSNPLAISALSNLKRNDDALTASINRLSTGLRVNRAGDDTAALNMSERMRAQVGGLNMAASNSQDAHNMAGTAESALGETHAILQRMRELAVQGASDTLTASDRTSINQELSAFSGEIDRIGDMTEWNSHKLFDGTFGTKIIQVGANAGDISTIAIATMNAAALTLAGSTTTATTATTLGALGITNGTLEVNAENFGGWQGKSYALTASQTVQNVLDTINGDNIYPGGTTVSASFSGGAFTISWTGAMNHAIVDNTGNFATVTGLVGPGPGNGPVTGSVLTASSGSDVSVSSASLASQAIASIDRAIESVSERRDYLGAKMNGLAQRISTLNVQAQNIGASETKLRDVDFAKEASTLSRAQLLQQSSTAMVAQANAMPQGVLALLR